MNPVLEIRKVSKSYGANRVVRDVSLEIGRGGLFSLLGPSGCGKTTTLRMVAGFEEPTDGDIFLNGVRINDLRPYQRSVSTVFQNYALFPHLTVKENVAFGLRRRGDREVDRRVAEVLDMVRMSGKETRFPRQLSGGERQRVALARSIVLEPDVLLLDEPLSALDPLLRKSVRGELKDLQRRTGITFLLVTHDQEEALSMSDTIAVMNEGSIEQTGPPQELYRAPETRFVAGFLGGVNWIGEAGVRPELTRVSRSAPESANYVRAARVEQSRYFGNCIHVESRIEASGERVVSEVSPRDHHFNPGDPVHVWWQAEDEFRPRR